MSDNDIGYYTLPVILSFDGVDKQVNSTLGKAFGTAGSKAGRDFSKGAGDGLKALQRDVDTASKSYEKLNDRAKDALGKVRVEEEKLAKARQAGKADQIVAAEERLAKARRDSLRISKEAGAAHSSLLDKQKLLSSGAGDLGGKLTSLSGITARLGPAVAGLGAAAAGAAAGGIALLGAGAVVATRQLYELGAQWDDISDTLRIKTGATGGALDALTESVQNIGRAVPLAYGQIGDVAAEVTRNLHLTGPALEAVTGAVANLGRLTGEQVDVRELGKAFRGFGVDAKDQVPALDSLFRASQQSGIGVNELISNVVKGGPQLRQLGLGFGESAALAAQFEQAGLDGTKMMAGLAKGLAGMADKGMSGREAFTGLVDRIRELHAAGKDAVALDMANKLFGAKGGGQFFEAIKNGSLDLDSLALSMTGTGETIASAAAGTADWSERWQLLKNEASDALKPLGDTVFNFVNEKLGALADWVSEHHNEIIDAFVMIGEVFITVGQDVVKSTGQMLEALGQLVGGIGNVVGSIYKLRAWSVIGDDKLKADLNAQAEAAFGWGEGLQEAGRKMVDFAGMGDDLKNDLRNLAQQSKDSTGETKLFGDAITGAGDAAGSAVGQVGSLYDAMNKPLFGKGGFAGQFNAALGDMPLFGNAGSGPGGSGGGWWSGLGGAGGGTAGLPASFTGDVSSLPAGLASAKGLTPNAEKLNRLVSANFPRVSSIGGWRPPDGYNEHSSGEALDVMVPNGDMAYGDQINQWMLANASSLGLQYTLWRQRQWNPDGTSSAMEDRGSPTQNHMDHVHARVSPGGTGGDHFAGTSAPSSSGGGSSMSGLGTTPASTSPINLGANTTDNRLVNAFGAGFKPGIGTPGVNEFGEPGYYQTDPRDLAQAQRRVEDTQQAIADADQRLLDAKQKRAELEEDILTTAEDRAKADRDIAAAERAANRARQDAAWAAEDAAETAKGKFTAAKKDTKQKQNNGGRGNSSLGELGSIAGAFLKETFGFDGSFFPDLAELAPVQMAGTLLNAFAGPMQGAVDGALGIQQPGWNPEMGDPAAPSNAPFGIPNVAAPPMPPDGQHAGSGMQPGLGGGQTVIIDQSINGGQFGWGHDDIEKQRKQNLNRAIPRIPVGQ